MNNALDWVSTMVDISEEHRDLIMHARKSILVDRSDTWIKKGENLFDVTMGAFDGAETCDIVGLYLLSQLTHLPSTGMTPFLPAVSPQSRCTRPWRRLLPSSPPTTSN